MSYIDVTNSNGDVQLVTNLKLLSKSPDADGVLHDVVIGTATNINPSERRNITYNFVIGNADPSTARDLIPGPINSSTLRLDFVALKLSNAIGIFVNPTAAGQTYSAGYTASIREQVRPFNIVETWLNPSTLDDSGNPKAIRTITYVDCYIESYDATRSMAGGDIRIMEGVSIHYKTVTTATPS